MKLQDKKIAILISNGYEQSEFEEPMKALSKEGAEVHVISDQESSVKGWSEGDWSGEAKVDTTSAKADAENFAALVIPGGVLSCDTLRTCEDSIKFVKAFFESDKPVGSICHGPQLLIEADVVKEKQLTSHQAVKTDLVNAGGIWLDESCVEHEGLVTSRTPDDLPNFCSKIVEVFAAAE